MNATTSTLDHSITLGQVWIKRERRGGVIKRIYISTAQLDGLNPELSRVDIRYLPSGRVRHLLLPKARELLCRGWQLESRPSS